MSFEAYLTQDHARPTTGRRITVAVSVALHAAAVVLAIVYSFWHVDELSLPKTVVTFFQAMVPPPPPAGPAKTTTHPRTHSRARLTVPTVVQPAPAATTVTTERSDPGDPTEPSGDGGGPPGIGTGVTPSAATFLPPRVATGRLAIDPLEEAHRPHLPAALSRAGMSLWVMLKVCVGADGQVHDVKVLRGADPTADPGIVAAVRTWRYHPYTVDGRPVPFCTNLRYEISAR
jgi:TonB family protein